MSFWTNNAVIYQVFIDRFAGFAPDADDTQPTWTGGSLRGVIEKIDYFVDLGINAVWLTPFFTTRMYHGYEPLDFREVDLHFGTKQDLKELIDGLHGKGIKVLMDFVPNHCSFEHEFFKEAQTDPDSPYRDWFYFDQWPDRYMTYFDFDILPKFNLDHRPARDYMIDTAAYWIEEFGFDGLRLDHAPGPSNSFWIELRDRVKALNPELVLIGEIALVGIPDKFVKTIMADSVRQAYLKGEKLNNDRYADLMEEYIGIFDGALDFNFFWHMHRYAHDEITIEQAKKEMDKVYGEFPNDFILPNFLDSHDKNRYLFEAGQDTEKLKNAAKLQFSLPQPPIIYYGTEVGMTHSEPIVENSPRPGGDIATRQKMNWQPDRDQQNILEFYKNIIEKRTSGYRS